MLGKIKKQRWLKKQNMLDLVPVQKVSFNFTDNKRIVLKIKRFPIKGMAQIFGKSEFVQVTLDEKGSLVWQKIDGKKTIAQICSEVTSESTFENTEMLEERLAAFILSLYRQDFVDFVYDY